MSGKGLSAFSPLRQVIALGFGRTVGDREVLRNDRKTLQEAIKEIIDPVTGMRWLRIIMINCRVYLRTKDQYSERWLGLNDLVA